MKGTYSVSSYARGAYMFGLHGDVSFDNVIAYIERLGNSVIFYSTEDGKQLNKKINSIKDGIDFREVNAVTTGTPYIYTYTVYLHRERIEQRSMQEAIHTVLHELGHILMKHLDDIDKYTNRSLYEKEAELFAETIEGIALGKIKARRYATK